MSTPRTEGWPFPPAVRQPLPRTHYSWLKIAKKRVAEKIYRATVYRDRLNERRRALYALDPDKYNRWRKLKRYAAPRMVIRPEVRPPEAPTLAKYVRTRRKRRQP
jgi:hypothetical protein